MSLSGYSVPETLTDDAGNALKSITVAVTGPNSYTGTATTDATTGVLRLGPLPVGDYTLTYRGRSVTVPVVPAAADIQSAYDLAAAAETPTGAQAKATAAQTAAITAAATDAASRVSAEATTRAGADATESTARSSADLARLLPRGAWVTATAYAVNDTVTANGVGWRCVLAHTSGGTFSADPSKWERFGVGQVVSTPPSSPATDDLYYDKAADLWKRWNGSAWVSAGSATYAAKAMPSAKRVNPVNFVGINRPAFYGVSLRNASGLAVDGTGGLYAAAAGTSGSGRITLPQAFDKTKPFRFSALIRITGDDTHDAQLYFGQNSDTNTGVMFNIKGATTTGTVVSAGGGSGGQAKQVTFFTAGLGVGDYECYVVSDGTDYSFGIKPLSAAFQNVSSANLGTLTGSGSQIGKVQTDTRWDATTLIWSGVDCVKYVSNSQTIKLLSVWLNQTGLAAPSSAPACGQADHFPLLANTTTTTTGVALRLPRGYDGRSPIDAVMIFHPNASNAWVHGSVGDANAGLQHKQLLDAGYLLIYVLGDVFGTVTSAAASDWGSSAGTAIRKAALDYVTSNYPQLRNVYALGQSMGLVDALNMQAMYPGTFRAIAGVSGVTNLSYGYSSESFKTVVDTAYGSSAVADVQDHDPNLSPSAFTGLPITLWHGTSDTTVHKTNHADLFATNVTTAGGSNVTVNSVTGGGHLDAAMWTGVGSGVRDFFAANT